MENSRLSRVRPVRPEELEKLLTLYTFLGDNPCRRIWTRQSKSGWRFSAAPATRFWCWSRTAG